MKFLLIRLSSIGDIVLTTPVPRCLRARYPDAEIHFLTKPAFVPVLEAHPAITKIHRWTDDFAALVASLKQEQFDVVIDLHHNLRSLRLRRALGVKSHAFRKLNLEKWLMTNFKWNRLPDVHIVDRYLETVADYAVVNDGKGLDYVIPPATRGAGALLADVYQDGYVAMVCGAAHATKRIPPGKMKEILQDLPCPVVMLGAKADRASAEEAMEGVKGLVYNACGETTLHESAALLRDARVVISPDTGLMHIAAALQRPLVAVWGNTIPEFGMYPYYGNSGTPYRNVEVDGLSCRPCSKIGHDQCPRKHFRCMQDQSARQIVDAVMAFWSGSSHQS